MEGWHLLVRELSGYLPFLTPMNFARFLPNGSQRGLRQTHENKEHERRTSTACLRWPPPLELA